MLWLVLILVLTKKIGRANLWADLNLILFSLNAAMLMGDSDGGSCTVLQCARSAVRLLFGDTRVLFGRQCRPENVLWLLEWLCRMYYCLLLYRLKVVAEVEFRWRPTLCLTTVPQAHSTQQEVKCQSEYPISWWGFATYQKMKNINYLVPVL